VETACKIAKNIGKSQSLQEKAQVHGSGMDSDHPNTPEALD
jgi:hypothetical protein